MAAVNESPEPRVPVSRWLAWASVAAVGVAVTFPAWRDLVETAIKHHDSDASILAPPVAAWLLWQRRAALHASPRGRWWAIPLAIAALLLVWWGEDTDRHAIAHLGAIVTLAVAFVASFGAVALVRTSPAWGALLFSIPVPGAIRRALAQPLQEYGARLAEATLETAGFSLERLGASLVVDGVPVAVSEACDGMRMVSALLLVVWAVVFGRESRPVIRAALIVSAPVTALACNAIRLIPTVVCFAMFEQKDAEFLHDVLGWLTLPLCLGLLELQRFGLERILPAAAPARPAALAVPEPARAPRGAWVAPAAAALTLVATWWSLPGVPPAPDADGRYRLIRDAVLGLPSRIGPWRSEDVPVPLSEQRILKPNAMLSRSLAMLGDDERAHLLLIHCRDVRDMLGHWPASCYVSAGWAPEKDARREITVPHAGLEIRALRHRFSRVRENGQVERTEVWSAFLAPGEPPSGSLDDLTGLAGARMRSQQGIAQVQVCFPGFPDADAAERSVRSVVMSLPEPLVRLLKGDFPDESTADTPAP